MANRTEAVKFYNQGVALLNAETPDPRMAYRLFMSAVYVDQNFSEGWYAIGNANRDFKYLGAAAAAYRRAVEANPDDFKSWSNLGHTLYDLGYLRESKEATMKALSLDPSQPNPLCNMSLIESVERRHTSAIRYAHEAWDIEKSPTTEMALAFSYLFAGNWAEGFKWFESRYAYRFKDFEKYPYPRWTGEDIGGKTLLLVSEQGLGDTVSFARFIPHVMAKGCDLVLQVQPALVRTFQAMFECEADAEAGTGRCIVMPTPSPFPPADYWTTPTSLPFGLGLTNEEIENCAPVKMPPFQSQPTWKIPDRKLHVGICWAGSPQNDIDRWRSMDVRLFLELCAIPGVQLYSLQIGPRAEDLHAHGLAALMYDMQTFIQDVSDTIAVVSELDLVVTAESFLGHLAGNMGKECWTLCSFMGGDYRHGRDRAHPLWYPTTRIFRQKIDMKWEPVFKDVAKALKKRLKDESAS